MLFLISAAEVVQFSAPILSHSPLHLIVETMQLYS